MKNILTILLILGSLTAFSQTLSLDTGETYAVVVGISDYQDEDIPDLRFADKDAMAFAGFLQSEAGGSLDGNHLKVLLNEQATQAQIIMALDWLIEMAKEGDKVIIYFSGHGDVEAKRVTQPGYLLGWNAPPRVYMSGGAINLRDLQIISSTLSIENKAKVVIITDACRAGKLAGSAINGAQIVGSNLSQTVNNEIKILSCQPDEFSIEGEQWGGGRGAFSYHLLDGLYGMADGNDDLSVNLLEIGRYLEDHVSREVAPQSQIPMTVGGRGEKLTTIFPDILDQLKEGKRGQMQLFSPTESRGIEDDVLATADSNIVEMYFAFKKSLEEKQFLFAETGRAENDYAEFYYEKLSVEPALESLYSSMRRNYAAALQDDAQQVMNKWLQDDANEIALSKVNRALKYKRYPRYLQRAIELLGSAHYMHPVLKARMLYFEGYLMHIDDLRANKIFGEQILSKYKEALQWHHELPHIYKSMGEVHFYQMLQPDSAEHYAQKATEWAPSWTSPYSDLATMYSGVSILSNLKRARYFLEQVDQIDSTAIQTNYWHINNWGRYFLSSNQFNQAEEQFKKIIQLDSTLISGYHNLGNVYFRTKRFPQAEELYKKTIQMDSTNHGAYSNLGTICLYTGKFVDGESYFKKSIELDSTDIKSLSGLARIYILTDRIEKGEDLFQEIIEMDSTSITVYMTAASAYMMTNKPDKAIQKVQELLRIDSLNIDGIPFLARIYVMIGEKEKSEHLFQKALNIGLDFARSGDYNKADRIFQDNGLKFFYTKKQNVQLSYAILYSLQNQLDKAFTSLNKAFENGYQLEDTFIDIKKEPGLAPLRAQKKRWKALLKKYFPDQYKE